MKNESSKHQKKPKKETEYTKFLITEEFSFVSKIGPSDIGQHRDSLKHYNDNLESAISLKDDMPIFLDTNVLLRTYSMSLVAREELRKFFESNKKRIYICKQVQKEFTKNRENKIDKFSTDISEKLPTTFESEVINKLNSFLENHKEILKDYDFLEKKLEDTKKEYKELLKKLKDEIENVQKANNEIKYKDPFLDLFTEFNMLEGLNEDEIEKVKNNFDALKISIKDKKELQKLVQEPHGAFPGMGDILEKPDDPYGDFIIFHEILKFVKQKSNDVIFLTYDVKKHDWIKEKDQQHLHYIENVYLNTRKAIYILNADRTFKERLSISSKPVYGEDFEDNYINDELNYIDQYFSTNFLSFWDRLEELLYKVLSSDFLDLGLSRDYVIELSKQEKPNNMMRMVKYLYMKKKLSLGFVRDFEELCAVYITIDSGSESDHKYMYPESKIILRKLERCVASLEKDYFTWQATSS